MAERVLLRFLWRPVPVRGRRRRGGGRRAAGGLPEVLLDGLPQDPAFDGDEMLREKRLPRPELLPRPIMHKNSRRALRNVAIPVAATDIAALLDVQESLENVLIKPPTSVTPAGVT